MKDESIIIYEYEEVLTRKKLNFMTVFEGSLNNRCKVAGVIWRYAIEHILHWSPEQALISLNMDIIKALKLDKTFSQMQIEYNSRAYLDFREILQYAFPETIHHDIEHQAITEYNRIMQLEEFRYVKGNKKYKKGFFKGHDGSIRASIILNYAINRFLGNMKICELYQFFGKKRSANKWLNAHHIGIGRNGNIPGYDTPLEYFHYSLPDENRKDIFYMNEWLKDYCGYSEILE